MGDHSISLKLVDENGHQKYICVNWKQKYLYIDSYVYYIIRI